MKNVEQALENEAEVLGFLKTRFPLHHLSNVFFRDLQYGLQALLERRGMKISYTEAEQLALDFARRLEKKKILVPIDQQSWVLHNEEYKTVSARKPAAAPAKAAAEKPAAPRPTGGLPPLKSASPAGAPTGLPPLKSAAPAGGAKPAGDLPPLKSVTPAGATPAPAPAKASPAPPPAAEAKPAAAAPKPAPTPAAKPATPAAKGGLPPITSSVPAGKK